MVFGKKEINIYVVLFKLFYEIWYSEFVIRYKYLLL